MSEEKAFCAFGPHNYAIVLCCTGHTLEVDVGECSPYVDELPIYSPDMPSFGLWVWEGTIRTIGSDFDGYAEAQGEGEWRKPTKEELEAVSNGECPWPLVSEYSLGEANE